jgi:predicted dinucleotide-binding enzyme
MRGIIVGGLALLFVLAGHRVAAADSGKGSHRAATSKLDYRKGRTAIRLERDSQGRWRRVETTRVVLTPIGVPASRRAAVIYRAPILVPVDVLRRVGQKLADREGGKVVIISHNPDVQLLSFAPKRVALAR